MSYSKYPGAIDDNESMPETVDLVTELKAEVVNRLRDGIIATETTIGVNPADGYATLKDRLNAMQAEIDAGVSAHASTHEYGGSDEITIQNLGSGASLANKVVVTDGAGGLTLEDYSSGISGSGTDRNIATWDAAGTGLRDNPIAIDSVGDIQWQAETGLSPERRIVIANATADGQYGTDLYLEPGDGGDSTSTTGGRGGRISLPAGNGGDTSSSGHFGGTGGNVTMGGGVGGKTDNATLRGGGGGLCSLIGGTGGQSTGSGRGGTGGQFLAAGGYGGDALGTGIGGPGGAVEIEGGRGGYGPTGTGGAGGDCTVKGGEGHIDGATAGGDLNLIGGEGYPYFAGGDGTGGNVEIEGGPVFGDGAGGSVAINGGAGGTTNGAVSVGSSNTSAISVGAAATPTTFYGSLSIDCPTAAQNYFDLDDGTGAAVSAANHVRLRSNAGTLEASQDGGAYAALGGGISGSGTDNRIMRWDGASAAQDSGWALSDADVMQSPANDTSWLELRHSTGIIATTGKIRTHYGTGTGMWAHSSVGNVPLIEMRASQNIVTGNTIIPYIDHHVSSSGRHRFYNNNVEVFSIDDTDLHCRGGGPNRLLFARQVGDVTIEAEYNSAGNGRTITLKSSGGFAAGGNVVIEAGYANALGGGVGGSVNINANTGPSGNGSINMGLTNTLEINIYAPLSLAEESSDPGGTADKGKLYTKDVAGVTELFYQRSDGTVVQLS